MNLDPEQKRATRPLETPSRSPASPAVEVARTAQARGQGRGAHTPPERDQGLFTWAARLRQSEPADSERRGRSRGGRSAALDATAPRSEGSGGRLATRLQLRLTLAGGGGAAESAQIRELLTGDLSSGGVFVECAEPPAVGAQARVEVCRPSGGVAFTALGEVVWRRAQGYGHDRAGRPPGFGLRFERLDLRDGAVVQGLIDLLQRQEASATSQLPGWPGLVPDVVLHGLSDMTADVVDILQSPLPEELRAFVEGFSRVADRDGFLWRWAYQGIHITTLSCVDPALLSAAREAKLLGVMYLILIDDALDRAQQEGGDRLGVFEALCQLPLRTVTEAESHLLEPGTHPCVAFGHRLWAALHRRARALPRAAEFLPLWHLDLLQLVQDARYLLLTRQNPQLTSETECLARAAGFTGLPLLLSGSLDLCAAPGFDAREVGLLREVLTLAQRMHHLSFVLSGWQRACEGGELSGAAVAHGVMTGVLSARELSAEGAALQGPAIAARLQAARIDSHFLTAWLQARQQTRELAQRLRSVDVQRLLVAHQRLLWLQLQHRGLV